MPASPEVPFGELACAIEDIGLTNGHNADHIAEKLQQKYLIVRRNADQP